MKLRGTGSHVSASWGASFGNRGGQDVKKPGASKGAHKKGGAHGPVPPHTNLGAHRAGEGTPEALKSVLRKDVKR